MPPASDPVRATIRAELQAQGRAMLAVSLAIGRNAAWLQQYLERGTPRRLPDLDRLHLAMHLGIDERRLGARDPWSPPVTT